jgi:hypothetical protein
VVANKNGKGEKSLYIGGILMEDDSVAVRASDSHRAQQVSISFNEVA